MANKLFDWPFVQERASDSLPVFAFISPTTQFLALDALGYMHDRWRWLAMNDADWDDTDSAVSEAEREFMTGLAGMIFPVVTAEPPAGTLACDGSVYDRVDYPALYAVLDAVFIIDADSFFVPDLRDLTIVGAGGFYDPGDEFGQAEHTLTEAEIPPHSHTYVPPTINIDVEAPGVPDPVAAGIGIPTSTGSTGGGGAHNNLQPSLALLYVIVTG